MQEHFFKKVSLINALIFAACSLAVVLLGRAAWLGGVAVSMFWAYLNAFFLWRLVEMGLNQAPGSAKKLFPYLLVKFPLLYLLGFYILQSRFFEAEGILIGLTAFFAGVAIAWVWVQRASGTEGPGAV